MITINDTSYDYHEGMTVSEAFRLACGSPRIEYLAKVDDTFILRSLWEETVIPDGAVVEFVAISSGG